MEDRGNIKLEAILTGAQLGASRGGPVIDPMFEGVRAALVGLPSEISSSERRAARLKPVGLGLIAAATLILHEMVHAALSKETEEHQLASIVILAAGGR